MNICWEFNNQPDDAVAFTYIVEFADGMKYIGYKTLSRNWLTYKTSSKLVHEKLETTSARFIILEWFNNAEDAIAKEEKLLIEHDVLKDDCFLNRNIAGTKFTTLGIEHSDDSKEKMRVKATGRTHTEETKEKIRKANIGKKHSELSKERMRKPKHTEESKAKIAKASAERMTEEARANISKANLGKVVSQETKDKARDAQVKYHYHTPFGVFVSAAQASEYCNCSARTVLTRCKNTKEKWSDWYLVKV